MSSVKHWLFAGLGVVLAATASTALADCVDFNPQRAKVAGAALARNPPSAAQLGVPDLDGLAIDGPRTTGDPKCDGPGPYKRFYFTSSLSLGDLIARWYPNIRARTEFDGMKREWFRNPRSGGGFTLTSGTRVEIVFDGPEQNGRIAMLNIMPAGRMAPLTVANQPYTVAEIVEGTPWPGGAKGPRLFLRADQDATVAAPVAASPAPAAAVPAPAPVAGAAQAPAGTAPSTVNCPPRQAQGGSAEGQRAGAELGGAVLGGGFGRNLGAALGGVLGSIGGAAQGTSKPAADPNCP